MKLLVSVKDVEEALNALRGGAHIIDVKNPEEGSLGAHNPKMIRSISMAVSGKAEVSATLGDLPYLPGTASLAALGAAASGAGYVKAGLFGVKTPSEAEALLRMVVSAVEEYKAKVIAAGYADYSSFGCINPLKLPMAAYRAEADGVMIDVKSKNPPRGLFEYYGDAELSKFIREAHDLGLIVALAGSLEAGDVARVYALGADIIGVRKGACSGGDRMRGRIHADAVAGYRMEIERAAASPPHAGIMRV